MAGKINIEKMLQKLSNDELLELKKAIIVEIGLRMTKLEQAQKSSQGSA